VEAKLIVLEGKHKNQVIPLPETIFLIGRDNPCHLRPHCQWVSKLHCAIVAWAGKVRLRDLKSRNGTLLNGQPIHGEVTVEDGDRLQVGSLLFGFQIKNSEKALNPDPVREEDVDWLLGSPADSGVLSAESKIFDLAVLNATPPAGTKAISAGQHLRDYFKQRKARRVKPQA